MRILNSKHTVELGYIAEDKNFDIFGFDYDFYEPMFKKRFEEKFIDHYYFYEIGQEPIRRFQHMLRSRLNLKYPYWRQLYETELKAQNIEFLLNKDLTETFIRELEGTNEQELNQNSSNNSTLNSDSNENNKYKESSVDNGLASVSDDMLTSLNSGTVENQERNTSTSNNKADSKATGNNKERETTTLISKGNIGITSSAELLEKWRQVLINLDEIIIKDCRDLFMLIY